VKYRLGGRESAHRYAEGVVPQPDGEALREPGSIASDEPYAAVERDAIRPAYAA